MALALKYQREGVITVKRTILVVCCVVCVALAVVTISNPVAANPASPVYDSGWVQSGSTKHTFNLTVNGVPTDYIILAADDSSGNYPTVVTERYWYGTSLVYGALTTCVNNGSIELALGTNGYAKEQTKGWYQRGTDYIRLIVYETKYLNHSSATCPPYRP